MTEAEADDAAETERRRDRRRVWVGLLLAPPLIAITCLVAARWAMLELGGNRGAVDLTYGGAGVLLALAALVATLVALVIRPWRAARFRDWLLLAAHLAALAAALSLAHQWIGAHIA